MLSLTIHNYRSIRMCNGVIAIHQIVRTAPNYFINRQLYIPRYQCQTDNY